MSPDSGGDQARGRDLPDDPGRSLQHRDAYLPGPGKPWTPIGLTRWSGAYLGEKGIEGGRLDAELMLAHVLKLPRLDLYLQHDRPLLPEELDAFRALLKRRASREPLQYILGTAPFRELELLADPRALIPRPETEVLVEEVLAWVRETVPGGSRTVPGPDGADARPLRAVDVGTGTGAIALSLLKEGPFGRVVATDTSAEALSIARENAELHGLAGGLELREGPLLTPLRSGERFHVLVSNPPYVPVGDGPGLQPEVRDWDPPSALFAGPEGMDVLNPLIMEAAAHLWPGGLLALEVGEDQAGKVARIMEETGQFSEIRIRPDLSGRERVVLGVA
jgi:release factor glutamine methyltransferase